MHSRADRFTHDDNQDRSSEPRHGDRSRGEGQLERADRNMLELLQEVRVAQVGVTILFAGLISVTFTERFARIDPTQRWMYVVALLLTTVTAGVLIAPAAAHRMSFGMGAKPQVVRLGLVGLWFVLPRPVRRAAERAETHERR